MKVSDIMTRDVHLLSPEQTIREAASIMADIDAGALPVGDDDRLVGMITDRDIVVRAIAQGKSPKDEEAGKELGARHGVNPVTSIRLASRPVGRPASSLS